MVNRLQMEEVQTLCLSIAKAPSVDLKTFEAQIPARICKEVCVNYEGILQRRRRLHPAVFGGRASGAFSN